MSSKVSYLPHGSGAYLLAPRRGVLVVGVDPGSEGVQGCPSLGVAERGEGNGGCGSTRLPPGAWNT